MTRIIEGDLIIKKGDMTDYSDVIEIKGTVKACEGAKLSLPNVTSVGGTVKAYEGAKLSLPNKYKQNDDTVQSTCAKSLFESFMNQGYLWTDNILAKIIEHKKNVYKIQICGQTKISYCIEVDGIYSHGKTIKKAKESLIYKISERDTSKYENYTLDTVITFEDAIKMYRCITGACEGGTRHFVENVLQDKRKKYTIKEVIELTKGQYNNEKLQEFFKVGV